MDAQPETLLDGDSHFLVRTEARIFTTGCAFLLPFWMPHASFVESPEEADFILAMNDATPGAARRLARFRRHKKPLVWWTIEDPNSFDLFIRQARAADFVFTADLACVPRYRERPHHDRVFWLPLAASPSLHRPLAALEAATDVVLSANWYENQARRWAVATVVDPLLARGHSMTLFCYRSFMWPAPYQSFWQGEPGYLTVAEQYRHGRVVIGLNNQRSHLDGRGMTYMTSMRTFEALACGKPLLSAHSDAYEALGFENGAHMVWVDRPEDAVRWASRLLEGEGEAMAQAGRAFVLEHHTYGHRLREMAVIVMG